MNIRNHKIYLRDKQNLGIRLERKHYEGQAEPIFKGTNIHYETFGNSSCKRRFPLDFHISNVICFFHAFQRNG